MNAFPASHKLERVNSGCSFPESPNINRTEDVRERMAKCWIVTGVCTHLIPGFRKPTPELKERVRK